LEGRRERGKKRRTVKRKGRNVWKLFTELRKSNLIE
jgi:hypothetical protein